MGITKNRRFKGKQYIKGGSAIPPEQNTPTVSYQLSQLPPPRPQPVPVLARVQSDAGYDSDIQSQDGNIDDILDHQALLDERGGRRRRRRHKTHKRRSSKKRRRTRRR